jgi:hypothetical protein
MTFAIWDLVAVVLLWIIFDLVDDAKDLDFLMIGSSSSSSSYSDSDSSYSLSDPPRRKRGDGCDRRDREDDGRKAVDCRGINRRRRRADTLFVGGVIVMML